MMKAFTSQDDKKILDCLMRALVCGLFPAVVTIVSCRGNSRFQAGNGA